VEIEVSGGSLPYNYSVDGDGCEGIHQVLVTDAQGCEVTQDFYIWSEQFSPAYDLNIINTSPGLEAGTVEITVAGGSNQYQYSLDGFIFQPSNVFTNLAAGIYCITIRDGNGCMEKTIEFEIQELTALPELPKFKFQLYPNPANEIIFVKADTPVRIRIADLFGNIVMVAERQLTHQISTAPFISGTYLVELSDGLHTKNQKLVIR
ncbi:MAG: T9SS type A sorting domain-containing protein, partial [Bacteroidota bacterium]|nr:T9SS type A sorting domain-containing protein [Bacteroidota bacterium]